jgi:hypothetical protein
VKAPRARPASLLLPHKLERYLSEVYFADFEPTDASPSISRNSVGHGIANEDEFNEKSAVIGLLVTQQLLYCFEKMPMSGTTTVEVAPPGRKDKVTAEQHSGDGTGSSAPTPDQSKS